MKYRRRIAILIDFSANLDNNGFCSARIMTVDEMCNFWHYEILANYLSNGMSCSQFVNYWARMFWGADGTVLSGTVPVGLDVATVRSSIHMV